MEEGLPASAVDGVAPGNGVVGVGEKEIVAVVRGSEMWVEERLVSTEYCH